MLRLMEATHPDRILSSLIITGPGNNLLWHEAARIGVPVTRVGALDCLGLFKALKRFRPDIVYMFGSIRPILWYFVARLASNSVVVAAERSSVARLRDRLGRHFDKYLLDAYIANSECAIRELSRIGIPRSKQYLIYNGISIPKVPLRRKRVIVHGGPLLICVANITKNKGQRVLLEAVCRLQEEYPGMKALLVGRDNTKGRFFARIRELGLEKTYSWVDYQNDVGNYLEQADLFVLPSLYYEGTPTSILEAMSSGVPVVGSDTGGISELVRHESTGLLVPRGDSIELSRAIRRLLESPELVDRIVRRALDQVSSKHSIESMTRGYIEVFHQLLGTRCTAERIRGSDSRPKTARAVFLPRQRQEEKAKRVRVSEPRERETYPADPDPVGVDLS